MNDRSLSVLPPPVFRGQHEFAVYGDPRIPSYRGNPLIEALPPIWASDEVAKLLMQYPDHEEAQRTWPTELRFHLIRNAANFFEPLPIHLDLEQRFSSMIRMGYLARNPVRPGFWAAVDDGVRAIGSNTPEPRPSLSRSTAFGFAIIGISGIGKTMAVESILSLYPQVIYHSRYNDQDFSRVQLVWLKLDCPFDGSVRGLCFNFFQTIDSLLDTQYARNYARNGRATIDELLPQMARVASIHGLGLLVIDELQHLSEAKSGGRSRMLNFFVQLVNTIGMPVVLIGTYKAFPLLRGEFRQARRNTGQGDLVWVRMENDALWRYFAEAMWRYQYVRSPSPLTDKLSDVLYDVTQGITDLAVKVYILAQIRAIVTGRERITPALLRSVAADSLQLVAPVLAALRHRDSLALQTVEDVYLDLDALIDQEIGARVAETRTVLPVPSTGDEEKETSPLAQEASRADRPDAAASQPPEQSKDSPVSPSGLLQVMASARQEKGSLYEAFQQAGYIRPATEFLSQEVPS